MKRNKSDAYKALGTNHDNLEQIEAFLKMAPRDLAKIPMKQVVNFLTWKSFHDIDDTLGRTADSIKYFNKIADAKKAYLLAIKDLIEEANALYETTMKGD